MGWYAYSDGASKAEPPERAVKSNHQAEMLGCQCGITAGE